MKKIRVITLAILVCISLTALTVPALTQQVNVQALIELFISSPVAAMDQLLELAKTDPQSVALVLAGVAERAYALRATNPDLAASLEDSVALTCVHLLDVDPSAAALAVVTIKDKVPEVGEWVERVTVAAGLERSYLVAASPVRP